MTVLLRSWHLSVTNIVAIKKMIMERSHVLSQKFFHSISVRYLTISDKGRIFRYIEETCGYISSFRNLPLGYNRTPETERDV